MTHVTTAIVQGQERTMFPTIQFARMGQIILNQNLTWLDTMNPKRQSKDFKSDMMDSDYIAGRSFSL